MTCIYCSPLLTRNHISPSPQSRHYIRSNNLAKPLVDSPEMSGTAIADYKQNLISLCLSSGILKFGTFTLKSGRKSPYFFNCGLFSTSSLASALSSAYAQTLDVHVRSNADFQFDVLFGPAYKGIPVAATTCVALGSLNPAQDAQKRYGHVGYSFNRKEAKDHGEGGSIVGESLNGKRVVIVDDVMTAGTAVREAISIIEAQGGKLVGIIVALDRQETSVSESEQAGHGVDASQKMSTIDLVRQETNVPVLAVLTLTDLIEGVKGVGSEADVKAMQEYRRVYGAS